MIEPIGRPPSAAIGSRIRRCRLVVSLACTFLLPLGCQSGDASRPKTVILRGTDRGRQTDAERHRQAGRYDEAIAIYTELLTEPSRGRTWDVLIRDGLAQAHWQRAGRAGGQPANPASREADRTAAIKFMRQALDAATGGDDAESSEAVARLGHRLGTYLVQSGRHDEAIRHYEQLLEGPLSTVGQARIRPLHELGNAYYARGGRRGDSPPTTQARRDDLDQAMKWQKAALSAAQSAEGLSPTLTASIHNSLALIHADRFESAKALDQYTAAVSALEETGDTLLLGETLGNMITELAEAGRLDEVQQRYDQLAALPQARSDPRLCAVLGLADLKRGRYAEAQPAFDLALHLAKNNPDESQDPAFLAEVLCQAAACALEVGAFEEADGYLREAEAMIDAGDVDPRTRSIILANRGRIYLALERFDEAEQALETRLSILRETQGPKHLDTLMVLLDLASLAQSRGHGGEALRRAGEAVTGLTELLGADHPTTAAARLDLASIQRNQGLCGEAVAGAHSAMATLDRALGPRHKRSVKACLEATLIAADCRETSEGSAAFGRLEREAAERFAAMRAQLGSDHVEVLQALVYFADISARTPAAMAGARQRYREAEDGYRAIMGEGALTVASLRLSRGRLLERMDRRDEALAVYQQALSDLDRNLSGHRIRAELLASLGDVEFAKGQFKEAQEHWQSAVRILADLYGRDDPRVTGFMDQRRR